MSLYILGYNTEITKDTVLQLSNYHPSMHCSGIMRSYDHECREISVSEIDIKPSCTELIFLSTFVGNTYGWLRLNSSQPLLAHVLYYSGMSGVVASNLVEEASEKLFEANERSDGLFQYLVPFNSHSFLLSPQPLLYISNPNSISVTVTGAFIGQ